MPHTRETKLMRQGRKTQKQLKKIMTPAEYKRVIRGKKTAKKKTKSKRKYA